MLLIYHLLIIYGTQKNSTDESICKAGIEMKTQETDLWIQGKRVGQIEEKTDMYVYSLPCVKQLAGERGLYITGAQPGAL